MIILLFLYISSICLGIPTPKDARSDLFLDDTNALIKAYFESAKTEKEFKKRYKKLGLGLHPDKTPNSEMMETLSKIKQKVFNRVPISREEKKTALKLKDELILYLFDDKLKHLPEETIALIEKFKTELGSFLDKKKDSMTLLEFTQLKKLQESTFLIIDSYVSDIDSLAELNKKTEKTADDLDQIKKKKKDIETKIKENNDFFETELTQIEALNNGHLTKYEQNEMFKKMGGLYERLEFNENHEFTGIKSESKDATHHNAAVLSEDIDLHEMFFKDAKSKERMRFEELLGKLHEHFPEVFFNLELSESLKSEFEEHLVEKLKEKERSKINELKKKVQDKYKELKEKVKSNIAKSKEEVAGEFEKLKEKEKDPFKIQELEKQQRSNIHKLSEKGRSEMSKLEEKKNAETDELDKKEQSNLSELEKVLAKKEELKKKFNNGELEQIKDEFYKGKLGEFFSTVDLSKLSHEEMKELKWFRDEIFPNLKEDKFDNLHLLEMHSIIKDVVEMNAKESLFFYDRTRPTAHNFQRFHAEKEILEAMKMSRLTGRRDAALVGGLLSGLILLGLLQKPPPKKKEFDISSLQDLLKHAKDI